MRRLHLLAQQRACAHRCVACEARHTIQCSVILITFSHATHDLLTPYLQKAFRQSIHTLWHPTRGKIDTTQCIGILQTSWHPTHIYYYYAYWRISHTLHTSTYDILTLYTCLHTIFSPYRHQDTIQRSWVLKTFWHPTYTNTRHSDILHTKDFETRFTHFKTLYTHRDNCNIVQWDASVFLTPYVHQHKTFWRPTYERLWDALYIHLDTLHTLGYLQYNAVGYIRLLDILHTLSDTLHTPRYLQYNAVGYTQFFDISHIPAHAVMRYLPHAIRDM